MAQSIELFPGATLDCHQSSRFKQSCLSIQFVSPMTQADAAARALLPAVLLRGCRNYPDMSAITRKLDELYGASVSSLVRRIGDDQSVGLYASFLEDRFAMDGDTVLSPMIGFLGELLTQPVLEGGVFSKAFVESEKRNLLLSIDAERNDKHGYAMSKLLRAMGKEDSFGIPRLGSREQVEQLTLESLYECYRRALSQNRIVIYYVGSREPEDVARLLRPVFADLARDYRPLPPQTDFRSGEGIELVEAMEVSQARLCMGFLTPITNRRPEFAAMQLLNTLFGAGMTSKLFQNIREKRSLCYAIDSAYFGSKGIVTVSAGIDTDQEPLVRQEILKELEDCRQGRITPAELQAAKQAILSAVRGISDSPAALESYFSTAPLAQMAMTLPEYARAVERADVDAVAAAARTVRYHSSCFLKGVTA